MSIEDELRLLEIELVALPTHFPSLIGANDLERVNYLRRRLHEAEFRKATLLKQQRRKEVERLEVLLAEIEQRRDEAQRRCASAGAHSEMFFEAEYDYVTAIAAWQRVSNDLILARHVQTETR